MTHATHTEAGVVRHRLDVGLAGDDPADADSWRLQPLRAGSREEDVAVVEVLHELDATDRGRVEHLVRLVEQDAVAGLLGHPDELPKLLSRARLAGGVLRIRNDGHQACFLADSGTVEVLGIVGMESVLLGERNGLVLGIGLSQDV